MITLEVDGKSVEVEQGKTVMDAARELGIHVPHFCYHKELSIAANCRMCLVDVEKAPKPLPACATPAVEGMKVSTKSDLARTAQKSVMEFLLINHPLDCPICDQGGECQLQDLAVGYGGTGSRFSEGKRVVGHKDLGPLISAEEMSRCIHCTRCVRFGQEVAGVMELGMAGRGEHSEIMSFVGSTVESEISGNMIDVCPVGALTSKPFRYTARTWELARRRTVSSHDGLGSHLVAQVKQDRVVRVVPHENPETNECWISDRDRFSYEGLNVEDRLTQPMLKRSGEWQEVSWDVALAHIESELADIKNGSGNKFGALASAQSTTEELFLLQQLVRGLGSENLDYRLRQADPDSSASRSIPHLGMMISEIESLDRILVIGSNIRKEHPLLAYRMRKAVEKQDGQLIFVNPLRCHPLTSRAQELVTAPSNMKLVLAQLVKAVATMTNASLPQVFDAVNVSDEISRASRELVSGEKKGIFVGALALNHPDRSKIESLARRLAKMLDARVGLLTEGANTLGAEAVRFYPKSGGLGMKQMFDSDLDAYFVLHAELSADTQMPREALAAMARAKTVVSLVSYKGEASDYATVLLPVSPFTETHGTFVNMSGAVQEFGPVVPTLGSSRPAWKILSALGRILGLDQFEFENITAVREALSPHLAELTSRLSMNDEVDDSDAAIDFNQAVGLERISDVPLYSVDAIVRRAKSLQKTVDAVDVQCAVSDAVAQDLKLTAGDRVRITQAGSSIEASVTVDSNLDQSSVRIPMTSALSRSLGGSFGSIAIEPLQRGVDAA